MEPVTIVISLASISELGAKTAKSLFTIGRSLIKARRQINGLARDLAGISDAFNLLANLLKASGDIVKPEVLGMTQSILDDCTVIYDEINTHISVAEDRSIATRERMKWPFRKAKVKKLQRRLETAKSSLNLVVNVLNLAISLVWLK